MSEQTPDETKLAELMIEALNLEDTAASDIDPEEPLFGEGLGLDSIDALEIALTVSQEYGVELRSDDDNNREIFANLRSLTRYIHANLT